jgi:hypothetical protein
VLKAKRGPAAGRHAHEPRFVALGLRAPVSISARLRRVDFRTLPKRLVRPVARQLRDGRLRRGHSGARRANTGGRVGPIHRRRPATVSGRRQRLRRQSTRCQRRRNGERLCCIGARRLACLRHRPPSLTTRLVGRRSSKVRHVAEMARLRVRSLPLDATEFDYRGIEPRRPVHGLFSLPRFEPRQRQSVQRPIPCQPRAPDHVLLGQSHLAAGITSRRQLPGVFLLRRLSSRMPRVQMPDQGLEIVARSGFAGS